MMAAARWLLLAAAAAAAAVDGDHADGETAACKWEPLRAVGHGHYADLATPTHTSCANHSRGACPYAVPFPDFPCLVTCVATEADCSRLNRLTPAVDGFAEPRLCTSCGIVACAECKFTSAGHSVCTRCFPGFVGIWPVEGGWDECVLWDHGLVMVGFKAIFGCLAFCMLVLTLATCVGAFRMTLGTYLGLNTGTTSSNKQGLQTQLLDGHDHDSVADKNLDAIRQGLLFSIMSSIKASALRTAVAKTGAIDDDGCLKRLRATMWSFADTSMADLGLGLQLFFRTQIFLIVVACTIWLTTLVAQDRSLFTGLSGLDATCTAQHTNMTAAYSEQMLRYRRHALTMEYACLILWGVIFLLTMVFHLRQECFIEEYDKATMTAEDYSLRLQGLPTNLTSEREVKRILEAELRMQGRIYGVSICYNVLPLKDRIEEMIEHIVEWDTLENRWCDERLSSSRVFLQRALQKDKEDLERLLTSGELQGSGQAYVVFKEQLDMARVLGEHRGISAHIFSGHAEGRSPSGPEPQLLLPAPAQLQAEAQVPAVPMSAGASLGPTSREGNNHTNEDEITTVNILKDDSEPAGLRYFDFCLPEEEQRWKRYFELPMRMLSYIGIYAVVAQVFWYLMIKPWQDNFIGNAGRSNVVIHVALVLFNFGIQTIVMLDAKKAGFVRIAHLDSTTFVWNTVLLLVTNSWILLQECSREGIRWSLVPPDPAKDLDSWWAWQRTAYQSVRIEKEVGQSLVNLMTDQIMMLYVLGEVANVLMPVVCYYGAIRFIFVFQKGTEVAFVQRMKSILEKLLPPSMTSVSTCGKEAAEARGITVREAERLQTLMPLLLWMEYTYVVIFPAMAFITFYLLTDESSTVCGCLCGFAVLFFIWQRYVMLWLYGKSTYDSQDSYAAFVRMWGVVLSMLPPASVWWAWRLGQILEYPFAVLTMVLTYCLSLLFYEFGIFLMNWYIGEKDDGLDDFEGQDPGYKQVMEEHGISWWNMNPVYVLKNRHCPDLQGHEVQKDDEHYWPHSHILQGFFELGKEFKQVPNPDASGRISAAAVALCESAPTERQRSRNHTRDSTEMNSGCNAKAEQGDIVPVQLQLQPPLQQQQQQQQQQRQRPAQEQLPQQQRQQQPRQQRRRSNSSDWAEGANAPAVSEEPAAAAAAADTPIEVAATSKSGRRRPQKKSSAKDGAAKEALQNHGSAVGQKPAKSGRNSRGAYVGAERMSREGRPHH